MKLGVLGPANGDARALEHAAQLLLFDLAADQVLYVGPEDHAIDRLVLDWARAWVGEDPSDDGLWSRAIAACAHADAVGIDAFIARERRRERLKDLKCLEAGVRTVEMVGGRVGVFIHDKSLLDEEDILPAALLVFGKSAKPLVRQVGSRTFISPGEIRPGSGGGALFVDAPNGDLTLAIYEPGGRVVETRAMPAPATGRVQILEKRARAGDPT
jgi:hypothetical protein